MGKQKPIKKLSRLRPSQLNIIINEILAECKAYDLSNKKSKTRINQETPSTASKHIYRRVRMSRSFQEEVNRRVEKKEVGESQLQIVESKKQSHILQTNSQTPTLERVAQLENADTTRVRKWVKELEQESANYSPSEISI